MLYDVTATQTQPWWWHIGSTLLLPQTQTEHETYNDIRTKSIRLWRYDDPKGECKYELAVSWWCSTLLILCLMIPGCDTMRISQWDMYFYDYVVSHICAGWNML